MPVIKLWPSAAWRWCSALKPLSSSRLRKCSLAMELWPVVKLWCAHDSTIIYDQSMTIIQYAHAYNVSLCVCVWCGPESASKIKYGYILWAHISSINQGSCCFTLDFGASSGSSIQVLQRRLHAQRGRYFCKAHRLEVKERSPSAREAT